MADPRRLAPATSADLDSDFAEVEGLVVALDQRLRGASPGADGLSDEELVARARGGDETAMATLLSTYRSYARVKARSYFVAGADREDVVQEGMIGLYKAIRDYDPDREASFRSFAELCITRQVLTAVKTATRHKHGPLNDYVSFSRPVAGGEDSDEREVGDVLLGPSSADPAEMVVSAERVRALQAHVDEVLSDLETDVLRMWVDGSSYTEIAEVLHRQVKSIDNALQRIKRKVEVHLHSRDQSPQP